MILDALEDAGLTLADVDGVCHAESAVGLAEYLGIHPTFTESTMTGGSSYEVHVEHAAAAIAAGRLRRRGQRLRRDAARRPQPRAARCRAACRPVPNPMAEWEMPYGLRMPMGPYALAAARHMHEFGTTSEQLAAIAVSTREWAALQPPGPLPRPSHRRRRARLPAAGEPAAPPRLLPGHRRRRRLRHDERRAGALAAQAAGLRARRRHVHRSHGHQPDARPHHDARRRVRRPRLRHGGPRPGRGRRAHGLRQLHHHRAAPPRGPRLLQEG